jgi:outer membrane protein OmpA-like peptidoglycan-associated protein
MNGIKLFIVFVGLIFVVTHTATSSEIQAAEKPAVAKAKNTGPVKTGPEAMRIALMGFRSDLKEAYQKYTRKSQKAVELYFTALAKIEVTHQFLLKNYKNKKGSPPLRASFGYSKAKEKNAFDMFEACVKLAEAAMVQMEKDEIDAQLVEISAKRDSLHRELSSIYEKIIDKERGHAAGLRNKLRAKYKEAAKLRQEMNNRFKALQSKLIRVRRDARGTIISMSDILFGFDKAEITNELKTPLAKIAGILTVYKNCRVKVEGHTDNKGTVKYNLDLSRRRAKNVKAFLISQGIHIKRLRAVGYGFRRPVASNRTKEGRQKNRRVDLVIIDTRRY